MLLIKTRMRLKGQASCLPQLFQGPVKTHQASEQTLVVTNLFVYQGRMNSSLRRSFASSCLRC
jgi:hypothetical protein